MFRNIALLAWKPRLILAALAAPSAVAVLLLLEVWLFRPLAYDGAPGRQKLFGVVAGCLLVSYSASAIGAVGVALVMRRYKLAVCGAWLLPLGTVAGAVVGGGFIMVTESFWSAQAPVLGGVGAICAIIISTVFVVLAGLPWSARKARALQATSAQA